MVLPAGAMEPLQDLMRWRGCGVSDAINFVVFEHRLLSRIQSTRQFRHGTRNDLQAAKFNAAAAALTLPPGSRERDACQRKAHEAIERTLGRLVLVTSL